MARDAARPLRRQRSGRRHARREDLRRLPAQRSRRHGDRAVLAARAPGRTGRHADHLGRAGGRRLALRLHRADNAGPAAATAPRPVARFRRHAPVDHRGDAPRARAAPPLSAARYPAVVAPPSRTQHLAGDVARVGLRGEVDVGRRRSPRAGPAAPSACSAPNWATSSAGLSAGFSGVHTGPGRDAVDADAALDEVLRQRLGEGVDRALGRRVVEQRARCPRGRSPSRC